MSIISVWKNGLYKVSLKWIWLFFIFIFSAASKNGKGEGREKAFNAGYIFFFTSMISKRKEKAFISLTMHGSRKEGGGLSSFGKS